MKRKMIFMAVSLLVIVNVSSIFTIGYHRWCRYRERCHRKSGQSVKEQLYQRLSLSAEQIEEMDAVREPFIAETVRMGSIIREKRTELVDILEASPPDTERIGKIHTHIDSLQARLQESVIRCILKEKEILTPDQQKTYFSMIRERFHCLDRNDKMNGLDPFMEDSVEVKCMRDSLHKTQ